MTADQILEDILNREGGYVDHPADRGGPTKFGITLATLRDWRAQPHLTAADLMGLSRLEAKNIYRHRYLEGPGYLEAIDNDRLLALVVDYAVHSGPGRATKALQRALGITDDGVLGPQTKRLLTAQGGSIEVYRRLLASRLQHLYRVAVEDTSQRPFVDGWFNRVVLFL